MNMFTTPLRQLPDRPSRRGGDNPRRSRCMMGVMSSLLTRGLRSNRLHGGEDWRELVTAAIQGKWPAPAARPQTLEAEHGLGILGKPYYFYVLRAEDSYGLVVFVLSEAEGAAWPRSYKLPVVPGGRRSSRAGCGLPMSRPAQRSAVP